MNMKKLFAVPLLICWGAVAMAETDYLALPKISDIQKGVSNQNAITKLQVNGTAKINSTLTVGGAVTFAGSQTVSGNLSVTLTNSCAVLSVSNTGTVNNLTVTTNLVVGSSVRIGGLEAVVSPNTTGLLVQYGTWNPAAAVQTATQSFTRIFYGGAPTVMYRLANGELASNVLTAATNQFTVAGVVTSFTWIAVGPK